MYVPRSEAKVSGWDLNKVRGMKDRMLVEWCDVCIKADQILIFAAKDLGTETLIYAPY